jgi:hypothetical protein
MTRQRLTIAKDLTLPLEWLTLSTVVYGARGSGKTTFGSVAAEEAHKARQRFAAIDVKGDWWGLKASADGNSEGLPVVVFGGDHADVPLEAGAGAELASIIAELGASAILDLENLSKTKQLHFLADFFERLYDANRDPLLLLLDEAQRYAPQGRTLEPDAARCLGAVRDLVKLGRKHGIGPILFTQRGAGLDKECSELCDVLVAFRTPGVLDQKRVKEWLEANVTASVMRDVMDRIAGLDTGTAIFASAHPDLKLFDETAIRRRETFDSSATPKIGQRRREPKKLAKPDLAKLEARMSAAIERQKADDPKELHRRIKELEVQLAKAPAQGPPVEKIVEVERIVEIPVALVAENVEALERMVGSLPDAIKSLDVVSERIERLVADARAEAEAKRLHPAKGTARPPDLSIVSTRKPAPTNSERHERKAAARRTPLGEPDGIGKEWNRVLGTGEKELLEAIAFRHPMTLGQSEVAKLAGRSNKSSTTREYLGRLRRNGLIFVDPATRRIGLTRAGIDATGAQDLPPTPEELAYAWRAKLKGGELAMFEALLEARSRGLTREELAGRIGSSGMSSSTFREYLGRLKRFGIVTESSPPEGASVLCISEDFLG